MGQIGPLSRYVPGSWEEFFDIHGIPYGTPEEQGIRMAKRAVETLDRVVTSFRDASEDELSGYLAIAERKLATMRERQLDPEQGKTVLFMAAEGRYPVLARSLSGMGIEEQVDAIKDYLETSGTGATV